MKWTRFLLKRKKRKVRKPQPLKSCKPWLPFWVVLEIATLSRSPQNAWERNSAVDCRQLLLSGERGPPANWEMRIDAKEEPAGAATCFPPWSSGWWTRRNILEDPQSNSHRGEALTQDLSQLWGVPALKASNKPGLSHKSWCLFSRPLF